MTKLMQWLTLGVLLFSIWAGLLTGHIALLPLSSAAKDAILLVQSLSWLHPAMAILFRVWFVVKGCWEGFWVLGRMLESEKRALKSGIVWAILGNLFPSYEPYKFNRRRQIAQVWGYHLWKFLFIYMQIFLFGKSHHFWKLFSSCIPVIVNMTIYVALSVLSKLLLGCVTRLLTIKAKC